MSSKYSKKVDDVVEDVNEAANDDVRMEEPTPVLLDTKPVIEAKPVEVVTKPVASKPVVEVKPVVDKKLPELTERQRKNMSHHQITIYNRGK